MSDITKALQDQISNKTKEEVDKIDFSGLKNNINRIKNLCTKIEYFESISKARQNIYKLNREQRKQNNSFKQSTEYLQNIIEKQKIDRELEPYLKEIVYELEDFREKITGQTITYNIGIYSIDKDGKKELSYAQLGLKDVMGYVYLASDNLTLKLKSSIATAAKQNGNMEIYNKQEQSLYQRILKEYEEQGKAKSGYQAWAYENLRTLVNKRGAGEISQKRYSISQIRKAMANSDNISGLKGGDYDLEQDKLFRTDGGDANFLGVSQLFTYVKAINSLFNSEQANMDAVKRNISNQLISLFLKDSNSLQGAEKENRDIAENHIKKIIEEFNLSEL